MGKYFITGSQGCGKTTVIKQLQELGLTAYNTDDLSEVTKLQHRASGETIEWPEESVDWTVYAWNWQEHEVERLLASDRYVFLGALVSNQQVFYPRFDKVFALIAGRETRRQRLLEHEWSNYHAPGEIDKILADHDAEQESFIRDGAVPISAEQPATRIVDEILIRAGLTIATNSILDDPNTYQRPAD